MSAREWDGTIWEDVACARTGVPRLARSNGGGADARSERDPVAQALADAAATLWRDLWAQAHGPCPHCGRRR